MSSTFTNGGSSINHKIPLGELITGEISEWQFGICKVIATKDGEKVPGKGSIRVDERKTPPDKLMVIGENHNVILSVSTDVSLYSLSNTISEAISQKMEAL